MCMRLVFRCWVKWGVMFPADTRWQANLNMEERTGVTGTVRLSVRVYIYAYAYICVHRNKSDEECND